MNMVDNLTGPMSQVSTGVGDQVTKLQGVQQSFGSMAKGGAIVAGVGMQITDAVLNPVQATFATRRAIGELASLGVQDLQTLENAARSFSDTWAGTTKADFITAAYDIKSGIASLTDEGIAQYTEMAGITAKATKASIAEMTSLFATGYGIYKKYYNDLTDEEFGAIFSAGIADSVRAFKTSGSGMAQAIQSLGASATSANVPLEEQIAIVGMLQSTMSGPEAGTKYKAFLRTAVKGGQELGLSFTDANNQLLSLPEILEKLRGRFGDTIDAAEKMQIQKAFGDTESIQFIDLLYTKTGELQDNILGLYSSMGQGMDVATRMANEINKMEPDKYEVLQQRIQNVKESIGNSLLPTINELMVKGEGVVQKVGAWVEGNQELVKIIMMVALALGGLLTVGGSTVAVIGGVGLVFVKSAGYIRGFGAAITKIPDLITNVRIMSMYAGDYIKIAFGGIQKYGGIALGAVKNLGLGMAGMARQAVTTAATAMTPLISSVWGFTTALLANPITWVVIGIVALIAIIIVLYNKCEWFRNVVNDIGISIKNGVMGVADFVKGLLGNMMAVYEQHGGGLKGVTAAILTGINGLWSAGFNFLDNLTGGKLSAIRDKFNEKLSGVRKIAGTVMSAATQTIRERLDNMRSAYEQHGGGIKGIAAAAIEGVKGYYTAGFSFIDNLTGGKLSGIRDKFAGGIQNMQNAITEKFAAFRESGRKLIETFTEGIKSAISAPIEAVRGGLANIRQMLPFSDAKTGPLSTLTLSGQRTMTTYAEGIQKQEGTPLQVVQASLQKVGEVIKAPLSLLRMQVPESLQYHDSAANTADEGGSIDIRSTRQPVKQVQLREVFREKNEKETQSTITNERDSGIHIENFNVDITKIKELPMLIRLLRELEHIANANGLVLDGE